MKHLFRLGNAIMTAQEVLLLVCVLYGLGEVFLTVLTLRR
jgi:hypothetical protein